jgi:hypothetical protein
MRHFINAMLAFAIIVFVAGLVPVSTEQWARLRAMKSELAATHSDQQLLKLRPSILQ